MSLDPEELGIKAYVDEAPLDPARRWVYADWLDDHDRPLEADRQRKWVEAYEFLAPIADHYTEIEDDDGNVIGDRPRIYADVMKYIQRWADQVSKHDMLIFDSNFAQDYVVGEVKERFWECMYVLTGVTPSEWLKGEDAYQCSC